MCKIGIIGGANSESVARFIKSRLAPPLPPKGFNYEFGEEISFFSQKGDDVTVKIISATDKHIDCDILLINDETTNAADIRSEAKIFLLNSANKSMLPAEILENRTVITFGLNQDACVTASSISEDGIQYCVQKAFQTLDGNPVEPQEFFTHADEADICGTIGGVTALLLAKGEAGRG